ncbi:MAG: hypothetical protein ACTSQH_06375 [Candidatus Hodarchaeales archaeon]
MLYLIYWEINEKFNPAEVVKVGGKLDQLGGTEGAETLSFMITPDNWGISLLKIESEEAAIKVANRWRIALPGVFKSWKGALAMDVEKAMPMIAALAEKIS